MSGSRNIETGSFRDRSARVFCHDGRIFRALTQEGLSNWTHVSSAAFLQSAMTAGDVVATSMSSDPAVQKLSMEWAGVLEHEAIPVITWPYEWSFSMLRAGALLTLQLLEQSLHEDVILKDATPFNIQFVGARPVFIDTGSFVPLRPGQTWHGYRQFCQMFLYPLMLQSWKNLNFQPWLRGRLEGISPTEFSRLLSPRDLLRRGAFSHVWLHGRLQARGITTSGIADSMKDNGFSREMILSNVAGLKNIITGLIWRPSHSVWSDYDRTSEPVQRDAAAKERFVLDVCQSSSWKQVWDLGCNQGRYSRLASRYAETVVALDSDHLSADHFFRELQQEGNRTITPLVADVADPTPSLGWRLHERTSLEHRSHPDLVFCLALIHHLVIGNNLQLPDVIDWLASLHATIVLEFVDRDDTQVRQLLANRDDVFSDYTKDVFRASIDASFTVIKEELLPSGTRTLFHLRPRRTFTVR